MTFMVVLRVAN